MLSGFPPGQRWHMDFGQLKRREFISLLRGAAAWPLAARAQHATAAFHRGLKDLGYVEGDNIAEVFQAAVECSRRMLRTRRERPSRSAAQQRYELTSFQLTEVHVPPLARGEP